MDDIQFKRAELEDKEIISYYFRNYTICGAVRELLQTYTCGPASTL